MLIVPFAKKMDWKKPPVVTIALVIINVILFSFWQAGDSERYVAAIQQYMHSSLPQIEFARYEAFLRQQQRNDEADMLEKMKNTPATRSRIVMLLQHDAAFLRAMKHGEVVEKGSSEFIRWREDRKTFEIKFNEIVIESHAFKPAFPEVSDAFTHMFMHGSIMHLAGNMVFLLIVGLVVEGLIGSFFYFIAYITGGLIAVAAFMAGNSGSAIPLLGASGAIAAMMGMYAALFGTRKIPFFFSLGFYFDYIYAPAYVLLVAWLGNEAYQLIYNEGSHIAYLAHFAGLLGGGLMGYFLIPLRLVDPSDLEWEDDAPKAHPWQEEYNQGMALLGRLETAKAADVFAKLYKQYPKEADILVQYYKSAKYRLESEAYHRSALAVLAGTGTEILSVDQIRKIFSEYLQLAKPKPRLRYEMLHRIGAYFLKHRCIKEARHVAMILIRHDATSGHTAEIALDLARQLRLNKRLDEAGELLKWVLRHHEETPMAAQARVMLRVDISE